MSFQLVTEGINTDNDPLTLALAFVIIVVIIVLLYIFRKRKFKSKYNPQKRHTEDIRDWGGMGTGKPIGDPRN
jgi:hypothetical protein